MDPNTDIVTIGPHGVVWTCVNGTKSIGNASKCMYVICSSCYMTLQNKIGTGKRCQGRSSLAQDPNNKKALSPQEEARSKKKNHISEDGLKAIARGKDVGNVCCKHDVGSLQEETDTSYWNKTYRHTLEKRHITKQCAECRLFFRR